MVNKTSAGLLDRPAARVSTVLALATLFGLASCERANCPAPVTSGGERKPMVLEGWVHRGASIMRLVVTNLKPDQTNLSSTPLTCPLASGSDEYNAATTASGALPSNPADSINTSSCGNNTYYKITDGGNVSYLFQSQLNRDVYIVYNTPGSNTNPAVIYYQPQ
jgi:hypothetical protein